MFNQNESFLPFGTPTIIPDKPSPYLANNGGHRGDIPDPVAVAIDNWENTALCNLYSMTKSQAEIIALGRAMRDTSGNLPPMPEIFPDYSAPIVRNAADGVRELTRARWGMPSSQLALMDAAKKRAAKLDTKGTAYDFKELLRLERDTGTTNIRNTNSKHWKRWLGVERRCVVPFTAFSEFNKAAGGEKWFALADHKPLAVFAGIWTEWTSVRKVSEVITTNNLFGFLTCDPNLEMRAIHPKAMPVILTKPTEIEQWMTAPESEALQLQRALPDGALKMVENPREN
jgi:putative SOS response-associated peptidase YedK